MTPVIEVAIGPGRTPGTFRVEVVKSPAGEASAIVALDVQSLLARRPELQHALLASAVRARRVLPEIERPVRDIGTALFTALLGSGEVAGRYRASAAIAALQGDRLRVVLRIDTGELAGLPWEAMYDEAADGYVCRHDQLVRHVPVAAVSAPLAVDAPLRILAVVSAPRGLDGLDVGREKDLLQRALARPVSDGLVQLHWARSATWADLHELLLDGAWHVLHFIGHGDYDADQDAGVLALTSDDGHADLVQAHRFASLLHQAHPMPRLVILNSCAGAETGASDLFSGTATTLVRSGVSAVAAMQYTISDRAAVAFAHGFYAAIARGRGVDDAVSSGRVAILGTSARTLEWITPVLYLRGQDTELFTVLRTPDRPPRASATDNANHLRAPQVPFRAIRTLTGQSRTMYGIAFSPDGLLLATSDDEAVRLWDPGTGTIVRRLTGHDGGVFGVAFSPGGTLLATASYDKTVRLWDPGTGTTIRTLTGHDGYVRGVAFSPDGTMLATTSSDQTVRLWNPATGSTIRAMNGHDSKAHGLAFSQDGAMLAVGDDKAVQLWHPATGSSIRTLTGHDSVVHEVAFSPDGTLLATASNDKTIRLWDPASGITIAILAGHTDVVWGMAFSPDGTLLASTSNDQTVRLWDPATGTTVAILTGHAGHVIGVAFSLDGELLATTGNDRTVRLWS